MLRSGGKWTVKSIVVYASRFGNTQRVAEAIADGIRAHGPVELIPVEEASTVFDGEADLVVIGCPTEGHTMTPAIRHFFDGLSGEAFKGVAAAAFDTRVDWPRWLSGSAGSGISDRLQKLGAEVVVPRASFVVEGKEPVLKPGELERALAWGDTLGRTVRSEVAAAAR
jgi:flavodoxin